MLYNINIIVGVAGELLQIDAFAVLQRLGQVGAGDVVRGGRISDSAGLLGERDVIRT